LPLDLEMKLQENEIAYEFNHVIKNIPEDAFTEYLRKTERPAYHPRMMMKLSYVPIRSLLFLAENRGVTQSQCTYDVVSTRL
jgi:hypothetical protein